MQGQLMHPAKISKSQQPGRRLHGPEHLTVLHRLSDWLNRRERPARTEISEIRRVAEYHHQTGAGAYRNPGLNRPLPGEKRPSPIPPPCDDIEDRQHTKQEE